MQEATLYIQAIDSPSQPSAVATLLAWSGEQIELASSISAPPGARVQARVVSPSRKQAPEQSPEHASERLPGDEVDIATVIAFRIKVHRCRRRGIGDYVLAGRILDLHRAIQGALSLLPSPNSDQGHDQGAKPA